MVSKQLKQTQGAEARFSAKVEDSSAQPSLHGSGTVIRASGMI